MFTEEMPIQIQKLAIYCKCGDVIRLCDGWTIEEISREHPISATTGIDSLLYLVPEKERDSATVEFYDCHNRVIPDPRIYIEDIDD